MVETAEVRLFVGVWPPPEVLHLLAGLTRPEVDGVRWTTPGQWHVTLSFLGEVDGDDVSKVATALGDAGARVAAPPEAVLGPASVVLGRSVLCVPVAGLDATATAVTTAVGDLGRRRSDAGGNAPYRGHLTLARARGRRRVPPDMAGSPVQARWRVDELCLIESCLRPGGARYTTLAVTTVRS